MSALFDRGIAAIRSRRLGFRPAARAVIGAWHKRAMRHRSFGINVSTVGAMLFHRLVKIKPLPHFQVYALA
jgi:hypothetical protein